MSTLNTAVTVAASALSAERTRIEVAVSNLANAESTRGADGQPYRRRDVVLATDTVRASTARSARPRPPASRSRASSRTPRRRAAATTRRIPTRTRRASWRCPTSTRPRRWSTWSGASRAYQANLTAINLIRDLVSRSLELGRA